MAYRATPLSSENGGRKAAHYYVIFETVYVSVRKPTVHFPNAKGRARMPSSSEATFWPVRESRIVTPRLLKPMKNVLEERRNMTWNLVFAEVLYLQFTQSA